MSSAVLVSTRGLKFRPPPRPAGCGPEEFFVGVWWPRSEAIVVEFPDDAESAEGPNWALAGSRSPVAEDRRRLVHGDARGGIAFRGYLLEPAVHGWCDARDVLDAWWERAPDVPNGVFAVARLDDRIGELELAVDALGVGSLYYRRWGNAVLFATSPRYLRLPGDRLDALAWRLRISAGSVTGDDSLVEGIRRAPPGCRVRFSADGSSAVESYLPGDFLGAEVRPLDDEALERVEAALHRAIQRCTSLPGLSAVLPLSAGHDSRRILGALLQLGVPFDALTVRIPDRQGRDVDARFAIELAEKYGFPHRVLDLPRAGPYTALDRDRRLLMHGESLHHTWILPLCNSLPSRPSMVFEGLAGDALGETGYVRPALVRPDVSARELCDLLAGQAFEPLFRAPFWPSREAACARLLGWLERLPAFQRGEWVFLLTRTRREIGAWSQRLVPAGHVTVYPYVDLDYLRAAFAIDAAAKIKDSLQHRCLAAFHPELAAVPGSRAVPPDLPRGEIRDLDALELACLRALDSDVKGVDAARLREVLPWRLRAMHRLARRSRSMAARVGWWRNAVLEMLAVERHARPAWDPADGDGR
ncbi:MAG TPA: hypothetical protein VFY93_06105 [Planctomycetota bacterium]|nr:hypothetical protein [Planctomycetota bacterium]